MMGKKTDNNNYITTDLFSSDIIWQAGYIYMCVNFQLKPTIRRFIGFLQKHCKQRTNKPNTSE